MGDSDADFGKSFGDPQPKPKAAELRGRSGTLFDNPVAELKQKRSKKGDPKKDPEEIFAFSLEQQQAPKYAREWRFAKAIGRQWRFDFAFLEHMLAVEIEGLVVRSLPPDIAERLGTKVIAMGGHATVAGFREDCEKYAHAIVLGWQVLRFEQGQVRSGFAIDMTIRALMRKGWKR